MPEVDFISRDDEREYWQTKKKKLNCDQVSWLMGILERLQRSSGHKQKTQESLQLGALLEIMEILDYEFEDNSAAGNALCHFNEFDELRGIGD